MVTQALLLIGLRDLSGSQVAIALAGWDTRNDHQLASRLRLPEGPESHTGAWANWLRSTPTTVATQALVEVLNQYPHSEPVIAALSSLYRESLASASAK